MSCSGGVSCKTDRVGAERPRNMMKVLFLVQKEQRAILDRLYDGVAVNCECDLRWLTSEDQRNLRRYFKRRLVALGACLAHPHDATHAWHSWARLRNPGTLPLRAPGQPCRVPAECSAQPQD